MPVDRIGRGLRCCSRHPMGDDLVAEEIEINPILRTPPLLAAEYFTIEMPGRRQIMDRKGQMKRRYIV